MERATRAKRFVEFLDRRSAVLIAGAVGLTVLLAAPMLLMAPTEQASTEPAGETFDLMDDVNTRFAAPVHSAFYLVEARAGDVLTQPVLWELYQNSTALLDADERGGLTPPGLPADRYLYTLYDSGDGPGNGRHPRQRRLRGPAGADARSPAGYLPRDGHHGHGEGGASSPVRRRVHGATGREAR